ncbi:MAG: thioredoxin domain-containing protein [Planctomycetota bacterium]|jgi:uncharacterized protein YyaL (SSP411 family)
MVASRKQIVTLVCLTLYGSCAAEEGGKAVEMKVSEHKHTNRLINESSPYLLQHAHNPVDWYGWGSEAFERAKREDKPIFLSIGYSTCHWCHVMERESFESEPIAEVMNKHFVSIKVDREQRPDVDAIYMNAVQMMTGSGGWPLSVFLTPEGKPFYGGTYFPPQDSYGRPDFERLLVAIADAWKGRRQELIESAGKISGILEQSGERTGAGRLSREVLETAYLSLAQSFDSTHGGFGRAPKFGQPSNLSMLLRYWYGSGDEKALAMVEATLDAMAKGGIYDHIGGGFHRYSTDAQWLVPHFEKMLYDQALLGMIYVQAYQATGKKTYARVAREVFDYVLRDMTDAEGGFYSAEDADSEGEEGLFYVWQPNQIEDILGEKEAGVFNAYYGVTKNGNFEDNRSILNVTESAEKLAEELKLGRAEMENILARARSRLLEHRSRRVRPHRDDKVIAGWNGLMISSMAYGGAALQEEKYFGAAVKAAEFVLGTLRQNGRLTRYYREGNVVGLGFLDDYAFMILGLLDLYEATFDAKWLAEARRLAEQMMELFADETGGFFLSGRDAERLIVRSKPGYDGAVPSGNSVAALALLKLGRLTMEQQFADHGEKVLDGFSGQLAQSPVSLTAMLAALDFWLGPTQEIVIAGDPEMADTKQMLKAVRSSFLPNAVVVFHSSGKVGKAIEREVPFVAGQVAIDNKPTAYVCENYVCRQPVNGVNKLESLLAEISKERRGEN